jgi:DNA-binding GntR family transcriptional regulator
MRLGEAHTERGLALPLASRSDGQNATSFVHDYLKNLILDLVILPETTVTEMQVAAATGVSRTPVREAFLRLHEERLVELIPRGGALVPRITSRQVRELYETRLLHEMHAVEAICLHRISTENQLFPLVEQQERLEAEQAEVPALIRVDRLFHSAIVSAAGNTVLATVYDSLGDHQQRIGVLSFSLDWSRSKQANVQHRELAAALRDYDMEKARVALHDHLVLGEQGIEQLLPH